MVLTENDAWFAIGFWTGTMNPFSRYPLFLLGVYAGELCMRYHDKPFPLHLWRKFQCCGCCKEKQPTSLEEDQKYWGKRTNTISIFLLVITLVISVIDFLLKKVVKFEIGLLQSIWWQAIVPFY